MAENNLARLSELLRNPADQGRYLNELAYSAPVTANRNMLAQALRARNKQPFQMKELTPQGLLDATAMATSPVPVLGDVVGLGADAYRFATEPESRTPLNFGLAALGLIPFVPPLVSAGLGKFAQSQGKQIANLPTGPARNQAGAIVYHGSPHKFDAFDSSKIGTGEGAQAYGHGLYFAENPSVAKDYQKTLAADGFRRGDGGVFDPSTLGHLNVKSVARTGDLDAAIEKARQIASSDSPVAAIAAKDLQTLTELKATGGISPNAGALYKVDLPDEAIAKMLNYDAPLSKQPEAVKVAAKDLGLPPNATGKDIYQALSNQARDIAIIKGKNAQTTMGASQANASSDLLGFGVPGIRYLDGGSRGAGQGTRNFVVFPGNESLLKILNRD